MAVRPLPGAGPGVLRGADRDVRQPGRLPADQPQAAAGLLDHRPRRLHDDGPGAADTATASAAVLFYLIAYLFMNLGAFAVVAFLRNQTGSEDLTRLPRPGAAVAVDGGDAVVLPAEPARHAAAGRLRGQVPDLRRPVRRRPVLLARRPAGLGVTLFGLLVVGGLNTVLSAVYYIKVMKVMILEAGPRTSKARSRRRCRSRPAR